VGRTATIVHSVEVDQPPVAVFGYGTDPARFAEWQYDVVRVQFEGDASLGEGARFTTTRKVGRSERTMTQEIVEVAAPSGWAARGVAGPIRPDARVVVEPLDDGRRSRVIFPAGLPWPRDRDTFTARRTADGCEGRPVELPEARGEAGSGSER
jgi:uncharacterized protein YndB with AHSA1/START domain